MHYQSFVVKLFEDQKPKMAGVGSLQFSVTSHGDALGAFSVVNNQRVPTT